MTQADLQIVYPNVLILSSKYDLSCDFIAVRLNELSVPFLRLNSEDLPSLKVALDPVSPSLEIYGDDSVYRISSHTLRSVYFRRPVYLREYGIPFELDEQVSRVQWAAFVRNLMVFDEATWINHPRSTYVAEHKAVQLRIARTLGFNVPKTIVQNFGKINDHDLNLETSVLIKGLDTVLARFKNREIFGFSNKVDKAELLASDVSSAPVTIQQYISDKLDIRVTVVADQVFAAAITVGGKGVDADWRREKDFVSFEAFDLPSEVSQLCVKLVRALDLEYGAIDLAVSADKYFFLEINPTGEWAWLLDSPGFAIDAAITNALTTEL